MSANDSNVILLHPIGRVVCFTSRRKSKGRRSWRRAERSERNLNPTFSDISQRPFVKFGITTLILAGTPTRGHINAKAYLRAPGWHLVRKHRGARVEAAGQHHRG